MWKSLNISNALTAAIITNKLLLSFPNGRCKWRVKHAETDFVFSASYTVSQCSILSVCSVDTTFFFSLNKLRASAVSSSPLPPQPDVTDLESSNTQTHHFWGHITKGALLLCRLKDLHPLPSDPWLIHSSFIHIPVKSSQLFGLTIKYGKWQLKMLSDKTHFKM